MMRFMLVALLTLGLVGCAAGGEEEIEEDDHFNPVAPNPTPTPAPPPPGSGSAQVGFKYSPGKIHGATASLGMSGNVSTTKTELKGPSLGMRMSISRSAAQQPQ